MPDGWSAPVKPPAPIRVVADTSDRLAELRAIIAPRHKVHSGLLDDDFNDSAGLDAAVIAADLRLADNIAALKRMIPAVRRARKRIFVIEPKSHLYVVQAIALGATSVLFNAATQRGELLAELADFVEAPTIAPETGSDAKAAAARGATALTSMFVSVVSGKPIDVDMVNDAGGDIANSIAEDGLATWLDTVRRHHEGTYQHCLLVTGVAVDFGLSLGMARADIQRLYSAAMFHDVGKAGIPLAVLDKPGQLDAQERALIETHPGVGYDTLKGTAGISAEVLDAVRHHHEYLDGSGYPDRLCGGSISDIVRILTVSDIFAALVEDRRYRPRMPREAAYDIICNMQGKLEKPLVAAFRDVALNR